MTFSIKKALLCASAAILAGVTFSSQAYAQRVQPMSYELTPSGTSSSTSLRIENTSNVDMTLELIASKIDVDTVGEETLQPAEDDFLIFPPQMILKAGKTQAVRVKYIGEPTLKQSAAYRISIKQIPIDLSGSGKSGVGMVVNFHTLAHVAPKSAKTKLTVQSVKSNAAGGLDMTIDNAGSKMARLSQTTWVISDGAQTKNLTRKDVADLTNKNLVMPGKSLKLSIDAVPGFNPATTTVQITEPS